MAIKHTKLIPGKGQSVLDEVRDELKLTVEAIREEQEFGQQVDSAKESSLAATFPALNGRTASAR